MRPSAVLILALTSVITSTAVAAAPPRTIEIAATDQMKYSVATITARPGESIRIRLVSKGTLPKTVMAHNVVVLKPGTDIARLVADGAPLRASDFIPPAMMTSVIAKTALAGPGEAVEVTFTAPKKPGRYPFICTFSGHYQSGMKGTLVVR